MFNSRRMKINMYVLLSIFTVVMLTLYVTYQPRSATPEETYYLSQNILAKEPIDFNQSFDNYIFYVPSKYKINSKKNLTVNMEEDGNLFTLFFGTNAEVDSDYFESINKDLKVIYNYNEQDEHGTDYFYIWEYKNTSDENIIEVMIGHNNRYIAGIFPEEDKERYIADMSYIFNSIKEIPSSEESDLNEN